MHPISLPPLPGINLALLKAQCAFADALAHLPDPRNPLAVLQATADHQAWFRLWLPLGATVPTDDTYRLSGRPPAAALGQEGAVPSQILGMGHHLAQVG